MSSYGKITFRGNYAYEWKINNFLNRPEANGKEFCSPKFAVTDNNDKHGILYFIIFPKGFVGTSTHVSLGIMLESESREFELFYRLSIRDSNDLTVNEIQKEDRIFPSGSGWGFPQYIEIDYLKKNQASLLPGGTLTICLEVIKPGPQSSVSCLAKDLEDIMNDREFADCEIQTSEGTIKCHKVILAKRSSVFKAMLQKGFQEGQTGIIKLEHIDAGVIKDVIKFIYCGKLDKLGENAAELFKAADMYQMDNLKEICGNYMKKNMNTDNVLDIITLADAHSDDNLKNAAMTFIVKNVKVVMKNKKWDGLLQKLKLELLENVVSQRLE